MKFEYNDGGRSSCGLKGLARDCVARSIAIASGLPYKDVHDFLARKTGEQRAGKAGKRKASADHGVNTSRQWFRDYMKSIGFSWTPTMAVGSGCQVHLRDGELPIGRLVVSVSRHYTAVIDGVIHDTHDPSRGGRRCVYGYWKLD